MSQRMPPWQPEGSASLSTLVTVEGTLHDQVCEALQQDQTPVSRLVKTLPLNERALKMSREDIDGYQPTGSVLLSRVEGARASLSVSSRRRWLYQLLFFGLFLRSSANELFATML